MCVDNIPNCRVLRRWERLAGLGAKSASAKPRGSSKPLCWRGPQISMHSDADTLMYKTSCWSALPKVTQGQRRGCESRPSLETCTMKSEGKCRKERKEQKKKKRIFLPGRQIECKVSLIIRPKQTTSLKNRTLLEIQRLPGLCRHMQEAGCWQQFCWNVVAWVQRDSRLSHPVKTAM